MPANLHKTAIWAIAECALMALGAGLLLWAVLDVTASELVLWLGLACAAVGVILWARPLFQKILFPGRQNLRQAAINEDANDAMTYELHRPGAAIPPVDATPDTDDDGEV